MASNLGVLSRHKRRVLMLWFFTSTFLVWQIMITMRTNKQHFRSTPSNLRLKALGNELQLTPKKDIQKISTDSRTLTNMPEQSRTFDLERESVVSVTRKDINYTTRNETTKHANAYTAATIKAMFKQGIENISSISDIINQRNFSHISVHTQNEIDFKKTTTIVSPDNVSTVNTTDDISIIRCKNIRFQMESIQKEKMQWVESVNSTLVFSAYHDVAQPDFVKIIAICYRDTASPYFCQVWYTDSGTMTMSITHATVVFTNRSRREFRCCYIICSLPNNRTPFAVSVVLRSKCQAAYNLMEVTLIEHKKYTRNFTMCLSSLHSNFDNAPALVEWIEFNKLLGANHFLIYNFSSGQNIQKVIGYYSQQGLVEVIQWPLPSVFRGNHHMPTITVHYFAQSSAYNDCLHRSKSLSKYVVVTDIDEFIVPHVKGATTWIEMFKYLPEAGSFYFRNCFFPSTQGYISLDYTKKDTARNYSIVSLLALKHNENVTDFGIRSKYITRTNASYFLRTHRERGAKAIKVDPSIGMLHHYVRYNVPNDTLVIDTTVLDVYGPVLAKYIRSVWSELRNNTSST